MEIKPNRDFRDLFASFNAAQVEFLVVGAHALAVHGHVRATKDLDIWVRPSSENAAKIMVALRSFGAPTTQISEADFSKPGIVFQIGVAPVRIDLITKVSGLEFDDAWPHRVEARYADQPVFVISRADLITNKKASARHQDLADVELLEAELGE
jgi:hypothetical protein